MGEARLEFAAKQVAELQAKLSTAEDELTSAKNKERELNQVAMRAPRLGRRG